MPEVILTLVVAPIVEDALARATAFVVGPRLKEFEYNAVEEQSHEVRNLILVVVTLTAAVTFQAGINPPGGLWQDNQNGHVAGTAIFEYRKRAAYYVFLFFNTLAFTTSTFIIFAFSQGFPFNLQIRLAIVSLVVTYACAVFAITPPESATIAYVLLLAFLPIVVRPLILRFCQEARRPENHSECPSILRCRPTERQPEKDLRKDAIDDILWKERQPEKDLRKDPRDDIV